MNGSVLTGGGFTGGSKGPDGDKGATGDKGLTGDKGPTGDPGTAAQRMQTSYGDLFEAGPPLDASENDIFIDTNSGDMYTLKNTFGTAPPLPEGLKYISNIEITNLKMPWIGSAISANGVIQYILGSSGLFGSSDFGKTWILLKFASYSSIARSFSSGDVACSANGKIVHIVIYLESSVGFGESRYISQTSENYGTTWTPTNILDISPNPSIASSKDGKTVYVHAGSQIYFKGAISTTYTAIAPSDINPNNIPRSIVCSDDGSITYFTTKNHVYKITGGDISTATIIYGPPTEVFAPNLPNATLITCIACSSNGDIVFIGTSFNGIKRLYRYKTVGGTTQVLPKFTGTDQAENTESIFLVNSISCSADGSHIIVCSSTPEFNLLLYSKDGGDTFSTIGDSPGVLNQQWNTCAVSSSGKCFIAGSKQNPVSQPYSSSDWTIVSKGIVPLGSIVIIPSGKEAPKGWTNRNIELMPSLLYQQVIVYYEDSVNVVVDGNGNIKYKLLTDYPPTVIDDNFKYIIKY